MTDRKKPGVAFWATVVVVAGPVLYVLSWGPVRFFATREMIPAWMVMPLLDIYMPAQLALMDAPQWLQSAVESYLELWG